MAKKVKITKGGQTVYPATVMDAVVHPDLRVDASKLIEEVNVSKIYPTGGIDGTNKYTLETAIAMIPASLRNVGIKCSFINEANQLEIWEYQGGTYKDSWIKLYSYKEWSDILTYIGVNKIDETGLSNSNAYVFADGKILINAGRKYKIEVTGNMTLDTNLSIRYYQVVGVDSSNTIRATYISKTKFEEESIVIEPESDQFLRLRVRGYLSGSISVSIKNEVEAQLEEIKNELNNLDISSVPGLFDKKIAVSPDFYTGRYWSGQSSPIVNSQFSCTSKIPINTGDTIILYNWKFVNHAACIFNSQNEVLISRINSSEFTLGEDGSYSYTIAVENAAYIGLNYQGIIPEDNVKIEIQKTENTFHYDLIEKDVENQIATYLNIESPDSIDIYIIAGQSNADGRGRISNIDAAYKRKYFTPFLWQQKKEKFENLYYPSAQTANMFGIEFSLASEIEFYNKTAAIIKRAVGGTAIYPIQGAAYCWKIGESNSLYPLLQELINTAKGTYKDKVINWKFIWLQGETDAEHEEAATSYESNLEELLNQLKSDTSSDIKIAIGKLKESTYADYISNINEAYENIARKDQNVVLIDTTSLSLQDAYHYNEESLYKLGTMMFEALNE